jgi:hypothetical protein
MKVLIQVPVRNNMLPAKGIYGCFGKKKWELFTEKKFKISPPHEGIF